MRIREHFLLGTEQATISATAKVDCARDTLFRHAVESILIRYQEEFGSNACRDFIQNLAQTNLPEDVRWRLRPEDSCWSQVASTHKK